LKEKEPKLRYLIAEIVRQFLDAECSSRCQIIPFPKKKRQKPRPVDQLRDDLASIQDE
jgi:hypothetical protein